MVKPAGAAAFAGSARDDDASGADGCPRRAEDGRCLAVADTLGDLPVVGLLVLPSAVGGFDTLRAVVDVLLTVEDGWGRWTGWAGLRIAVRGVLAKAEAWLALL